MLHPIHRTASRKLPPYSDDPQTREAQQVQDAAEYDAAVQAQPRPFDAVSAIMAYEQGESSDLQTLELFAHLIRTNQVWSLQGSYGRTAIALMDEGLVDGDGEITDHARSLLEEV